MPNAEPSGGRPSETPHANNQDAMSVPVEVWWGLEWVKTEGWLKDDKTITARLTTRTGEVKMCRIRNIKGVKMWRQANVHISSADK